MILRGEIEQGQPLREVSLAASIGVSRNTMREAIRVLAREGIVTHEMHHGAMVTRSRRPATWRTSSGSAGCSSSRR